MKKQIIISSIIATAILGSTGIAILSKNASAEPNNNTTPLLAANSVITTTKPVSASKNETVYVITDESGNTKSRFIGSTIYNGAEELPFSFKVTYYLDGQEISGKDLAGKSGHVKIVYNYTSTARYQGKYIPFLAATGITLDGTKFSNIKVQNGKIISESSDNCIIAGYALAGINADLNTDLLPDSFIVEADTTNFKLDNTYTVFMNDIIADLDTSKLSDLDGLISSINQLSDGMNKIVSGATDLSNGLGDALNGTKQLYEGSKTLASNLKEASTKTTQATTVAAKLKDGLNTLANYGSTVLTFENVLKTTSDTLSSQTGLSIELTKNNYQTLLDNLKTQIPPLTEALEATKQQLIGVEKFCTQLDAYTQKVTEVTTGVSGLSTGLDGLSAGLTKLSDGATTISNGLGSLVEGETKLYEGSITLKDGLNTIKTSGIDKLVNFANKDLAGFTRNARATVNAASSYKSFGGTDAKSVKFIVKTPSI